METENIFPDMENLCLDDQFEALLYKKLMNKKGSPKRRLKKYYKDKYKKTGIIPAPLLLVKQGIMEGRKCSGRPRSIDGEVKKRFVEMVKASCDHTDTRFIFVTRRARTIKNYHKWLENDFMKKISLRGIRRLVKHENLYQYLEKPDFDEETEEQYYFDPEPVFDLIQVDGCIFQYFKIRDHDGKWRKPQVIEFFDTGSRYMFVLDAYFSESSLNSIDLFNQFLLSTPFPKKTIRIRPDNAKGFLNLKHCFNAVNLKYSMPEGFYLKPNFARVRAPKDKAHLESSHRSLHNFEARIIKIFEEKIVKVEPGIIYRNKKPEKIAVTFLDINLAQLRSNGIIQEYQREHNFSKHYYSEKGKITPQVPNETLQSFLSQEKLIYFTSAQVKEFIKYGYDKKKAVVTKEKKIRFDNQEYYVAVGAGNFSRNKSTTVYISCLDDKLLIFEFKEDGLLIGEALCQKSSSESCDKKSTFAVEANEVELITQFLTQQGMEIDQILLIEKHHEGLTLNTTKEIYKNNKNKYKAYLQQLHNPAEIKGIVLFNAFLVDCERHQRKAAKVATFAHYEG